MKFEVHYWDGNVNFQLYPSVAELSSEKEVHDLIKGLYNPKKDLVSVDAVTRVDITGRFK